MKKFILISIFMMLFTSLIFADTTTATSTLQITGYKSEKLFDSILKVYVYNTTSGQSSTTEFGSEIDILDGVAVADISDSLNGYINDYKDVFSIKVQTNLKSNINVNISVSPFISQDSTQSSVIKTIYSLTTSNGTYTYYKKSGSGRSGTYYIYTGSWNPNSLILTVGDNGDKNSTNYTIVQSISAKKQSGSGSPSSYTIPDDYIVLYPAEENRTIDSMIYVKMKLNTTLDNILPNVKYVAPVIITVSTE